MKQMIRADALLAMFGVVCCIGTASYLAPKGAYFLPNALIYLCLQLAVVAIGLLVWPRRAVVGGVAVAMSLYLAAFHWWVNLVRDPDGLIWIYLLFSLPGAVAAALGMGWWLKSRPPIAPWAAFGVTAGAVIGGICINQGAVYLFMRMLSK